MPVMSCQPLDPQREPRDARVSRELEPECNPAPNFLSDRKSQSWAGTDSTCRLTAPSGFPLESQATRRGSVSTPPHADFCRTPYAGVVGETFPVLPSSPSA